MITEKQIQEECKNYLFKNYKVKNNEAKLAEYSYLAGVRMVLEKTGMKGYCNNDCPDAEFGNCFCREDCCKYYF